MAAKKKTNTSASTEPPVSAKVPAPANAIIPTNIGNNNHEDNSEDTSVDDLADGEFEVELLDMGISREDIQAMRRFDACLVERSCHARQVATQAGPSSTAVTRSKGKQRALTIEELEEQLNKLEEEELHCTAMRQQIHERMAMLQQDQAPRLEPASAPHAPQPVRVHP
jgi:hypothetical protein